MCIKRSISQGFWSVKYKANYIAKIDVEGKFFKVLKKNKNTRNLNNLVSLKK